MNYQDRCDCLHELKNLAITLGVKNLANYILDDERFKHWSGSGKPNQHHYGDYGLIIHTYEVVKSSLKMVEFYDKYEINKKVLFLGALFHDYGKTYDYEYCNVMKTWRKTQHSRKIHHVSRSALLWEKCWLMYLDSYHESPNLSEEDTELNYYEAEEVTHAILSHHGRREWGSPVSPNSREAWILHLCDAMSARLYDCDTLERFD